MEHNCQISQLDGVINNSNGLKVGEMLLKPVNVTTGTLHAYIQGDSDKIVFADVIDGQWKGGGTTQKASTSSTVDIIPDSTNAKVIVSRKYNLTRLQLNYVFEIDLEDIEFCESLTFLRCYHTKGDIKALANLPLTMIDIYGNNTFGSIADIPTSAVSLSMTNVKQVSGNINTAFAQHSNLTSVNVSGCPNITGSASAFLAAHPGCTLTYAGSGVTS